MALYLVTGGAGFIGSNLARFLLEQGEKVRVLDNFSTGKRENLEEIQEKIDLLEGDVCDSQAVERAVEGVDYVLHQAAIPSVPRSVENPFESHEANTTGTLRLLEASRRAKVRRVVYASSSSVYGANEALPKQESMLAEPLSPYAVAKLAAEQYCHVYYHLYGLETVSLRYFNIFGPRQDPKSPYTGVISCFIEAILTGNPPTIYGDGEQTRDFTFVENVARANFAACHCTEGLGAPYNIGCGSRISINGVWETMARLAGVDLAPKYGDPRIGDVPHSLADVVRAREAFDYKPQIDFAEGVKRTLAFYKLV